MRLFAAVLPPPAAIDDLAAELAAVRRLPEAERLRWTGHDGWHFTLAFYGEVAEELLPELHTRLARAAHRHPPFPLRISGGGRFDHKVLWAGAAGGREAMRHLADSTGAAARRAGVDMDEHRRYTPHLTLARHRGDDRVDLVPFVDALAEYESAEWEVAELALVRSNLPTSGVPGEQPRYEKVASWPLGHAGR
ncbi:RNA 2',3'-cyclic phosphodiesterase [Streptomyces ochraceiscleroticus]|uniref:RNA 2',3'-cyclic phosphodiesterase n=1 Tax=Streptomyces ochraceiscleroticus TaxID=47761 RepID=A0ABW1MG69_9ACTN|nr:RNA 2',3'-cyclic phosphodiesterase [Streptomyces ochraceiscleroticus]